MTTISRGVKMYGLRCVSCGRPVHTMYFRQDEHGNWWTQAMHVGATQEPCFLLAGRPVRRASVLGWAA